MPNILRAAIAALTLLAAPPAPAQHNGAAPFRAPGQREFTTRNYTIVTDAPLHAARDVGRHMDAVFDEYARRLNDFLPRTDQPVRIYLWNSEKTYHEFLASRSVRSLGAAGMFFADGENAGLTTWLQGQQRRALEHVLQHEGFHQFAWLRIGHELPIWANEGLAEYFGQGILVRGRLEIGLAPEGRLLALQRAVLDERVFGFAELLAMKTDEWNRRVTSRDPRATLMYTQAWSMAHFLVHAENGEHAGGFEEYLHLVAEGRPSGDAFREAFRVDDPAVFEPAWKRFVLELSPDPISAATERLEFIAYGLLALRERGRTPANVDDLRAALREWQFRLERREHGLERTQDSRDDFNFEAPAPLGGGRAALRLTPPHVPGAPPGAVVEGLRVKVRLAWRSDGAGGWTSSIVYE